jgi:hypothetical protein
VWGSEHNCEQLHDDSDSFSDISHDSDTDITAKIIRYDLSDSAVNFDDWQAGENAGDYSGGGGDYNTDDDDDDDDNKEWAL